MGKTNADNDEDIVVTLSLDEGDVDCEIFTIFTIGEQDYIVLIPLDEKGDKNEEGIYYYYRYFEDAEGNYGIGNIETEEEYEMVDERFDQWLDDQEFEEL